MKKLHHFLIAAALVALVALVIFTQLRQRATPPAQVVATPAPVIDNTLPQTGDLLAQIARVPQIADASPTPVQLGAQANGAIRFLGVQRGWRLPAGASFVASDPAETARGFLLANRAAFGLANPRIGLTIFRTLANLTFTTIRLQQTYGTLPVLAAETVVHVDNAGEIRTVLADLATQLPNLDRLPLPLVPKIPEAQAPARAVALVRTEMKRGPVRAAAPQLVVYVPDVLGLPGEPALAWQVAVESPAEPVQTRGRVIVDADTGALLNYLDDIHSFSNRRIYDDNSSTTTDPIQGGANDNAVRVEGGAATGIAAVDNLYDFIRQIDNFYLANHQRNGFDGAGGTIFAVARLVPMGQTAPWDNATGGNNGMRFGLGFIADDIVAHEFTHCVTDATSRLLYQNASGAINESLSDIWGEFLDLTNGGQAPNGNDAANVRWEIGEDLPAGPVIPGFVQRPAGALRSMSDPGDLLRAPATPRFNDPDKLSSGNYVAVALNGSSNDNGGVHSNSGVCNKLVYLLTDGDSFNGQTITPEGIGNVATLFYQVQVNFLVPAADWRDLYFAITQAAANLEWSAPRQININHACTAVEISTAAHDYYIDRSSPAVSGTPPQPVEEVGIPNLVVYPNSQGAWGPYRSLPAGVAAINDGGTLNLNGAADSYNAGPGGPVTISKPMTLKTYNAPATIIP